MVVCLDVCDGGGGSQLKTQPDHKPKSLATMALQMFLMMNDTQLATYIHAHEQAIAELENNNMDDLDREDRDLMKRELKLAKRFMYLLPDQKQQVRDAEAQRKFAWDQSFEANTKAVAATQVYRAKLNEFGLE